MPSSRNRLLALFAYVVLAALGWVLVGRAFQPDDNFVLYRIAASLAGRGLPLYPMIDPAVTTFPLVPLALRFVPLLSLPDAGGLLSVIAVAAGAFFLARLCGERWLAGLLYLLALVVQPALAALIALALGLAALDSARGGRWFLAGVLAGLAALADGTALIPALLIATLLVRDGAGAHVFLRYALPTALIPAVGLVLLWAATHGAPLISLAPAMFTFVLPVLGVIALFGTWPALRERPYAAILVAWSALAAALSLAGGQLPTAAALPGAIAALTGSQQPTRRTLERLAVLGVLAEAAFVFVLLSPLADGRRYDEQLGRWLAGKVTPTATVATADVGTFSFYANATVIDLSGRLQRNPFDTYFFARYAPDVVVLKAGEEKTVPWPGFATTYARVESPGGSGESRQVYFRVVNYSALDDHGVDVNFGARLGRADLRLVNVGLGNTLKPGDLVRVRLDWELAYRPSFPIEIRLNLLNAQGLPVGGANETFPPEVWQAGKMSTFHLLPLSKEAQEGRVSLYLGVFMRGGSLVDLLKVAEVGIAK